MAAAIASFARSKSPGSHALTIKLYSQYSETLLPQLLTLYTHLFETFTLLTSMREVVIVLIPKPGKDLGIPKSYRPISLLQVDIKILAKILALLLNQVILTLVHKDQAGFMPGSNTLFYLRKLFMNIQAHHDNIGERVVVSGYNQGVQFDSVEMPFTLWLWP